MKEGIDLGLLTAEEFVTRRSETLIRNPNAQLDEEFEVASYLSKLDAQYRDKINALSLADTKPLPKSVREIVTIIAYHEGPRIRHTLDTYVGQDLGPNQFEIILLDNHPYDQDRDNTHIEVERFQKDNPDVSVIYAHKVWQTTELATVGNARKYVFDIALVRMHARGKGTHETILISNDADTVDLDKNYLSAIKNEFQENSAVDALVTPTVVPLSTILKPNIYAALSLWDAIDDIIARHEPHNLIGRSSAYRASIFAAVGGYNPNGKMAGDLETGFLIADARCWDPRSVIRLATTKHVTDPRRILESVASRTPIDEMYYKFVSSPEVRDANTAQLLTMVPDDLDWELFEEDADMFWNYGDTGMYKWRGELFAADFKQAMDKIGAQYEIKDSRLYLTNIDQLLQSYKNEFDNTLQIVHSTRRPFDQDRIKTITQFFSSISDSTIGCRKKHANQIARALEFANQRDDLDQIRHLQEQYERFAGHKYKPHSR